MSEDRITERAFEACDNPACNRKVRVGVLYCCGGCSASHDTRSEIAGPGDPESVRRVFAHSDDCEAKAAARGVWEDEYALLMAQHRKRLTMRRG